MKILISFIPTVASEFNYGGSTAILRQVALYLASHGDQITIICNRRPESDSEYLLHPMVKVLPIYRFKDTFPNPYFVPPYSIAHNIKTLYDHARVNDVLIIFDSGFIFSDIFPKSFPIIYSLRDYLYSESLQGAFLAKRGSIIVNSQFVKDSLLATVGSIYPEIEDRVELIYNGVDVKRFKRVKIDKIKKIIRLNNYNDLILLFPHRPDPDKGIISALDIVEDLVKNYKKSNALLLIPRGINESVGEVADRLYDNLRSEVRARGIQANVLIHPWIPLELMPEYYSLGYATLCVGNIVEAFSNVALESLACGTPVYASKVPDWCVFKFNPNDISSVSKAIISSMNQDDSNNMKISSFIREHYSAEEMCEKYWKHIHSQKTYKPLKFEYRENYSNLRLAPWCFIASDKIYNDYMHEYIKDDSLVKFFNKIKKKSFTLEEAKRAGLSRGYLQSRIKSGLLTSV
jgi:glycosyltransferase involved in cell wall biosynthesis